MSSPDEIVVTPDLLRGWELPSAGAGKYSRGQVVVVGGAARTPGAAMLGAWAALRVGAGRLTLAVAGSVAPHVAVALPEAGVVPLGETDGGHVVGSSLARASSDLEGADAVLAGSGLDDADEAEALVRLLPDLVGGDAVVVLDAFALGVLPRCGDAVDPLRGRLVLTPNPSEAGRLLGRDVDDLPSDLLEIARRWGAVVACQSFVASDDGRLWRSGAGHPGLGTSGSGDVLAGAVAGLAARGATPAQAAVWATHAHATAGDRLSVGVGPMGFLASELLDELPRVLVEVGA
ncbi:NAD(P)H-hydrate dehydratase [Frigoribacterium endophyticum]|uniref:NAD(P)H-hydrate dehydratase n=1 Tax=Frigoribacterium endophyticum TaxID=1522176 RepID=UPI00142083D4|nr:NAD(P)H-hydrate dehydratase [Frigoribacterium endophyticum]NII49891.1 hydroxyethylthiazole kinase-like uncharacterized protein yjeF [Frigoribacterium endophyticum]